MTALRRPGLALAAILLSACNMVISEEPMFGEMDRSKLVPKDGIWLADVKDCQVDVGKPESEWPNCALWLISRNEGRELFANGGKGQSERMAAIIASGKPAIVQGRWIDGAKNPPRTIYGFFAIEPRSVGRGGRFAAASVWPVECGIQSGSGIEPFPGIGKECRPSSKAAIRNAAQSSKRTAEISTWRWLRPEQP